MEINNFNEPTSLKEAFQGLTSDSAGVIQGKVISTSPLKIQAVNDDKLIMSKNILSLPRHLSTYWTTIDIPALDLIGAGMAIYNGLKIGDTVYLLSFNQGKKYYILDREA